MTFSSSTAAIFENTSDDEESSVPFADPNLVMRIKAQRRREAAEKGNKYSVSSSLKERPENAASLYTLNEQLSDDEDELWEREQIARTTISVSVSQKDSSRRMHDDLLKKPPPARPWEGPEELSLRERLQRRLFTESNRAAEPHTSQSNSHQWNAAASYNESPGGLNPPPPHLAPYGEAPISYNDESSYGRREVEAMPTSEASADIPSSAASYAQKHSYYYQDDLSPSGAPRSVTSSVSTENPVENMTSLLRQLAEQVADLIIGERDTSDAINHVESRKTEILQNVGNSILQIERTADLLGDLELLETYVTDFKAMIAEKRSAIEATQDVLQGELEVSWAQSRAEKLRGKLHQDLAATGVAMSEELDEFGRSKSLKLRTGSVQRAELEEKSECLRRIEIADFLSVKLERQGKDILNSGLTKVPLVANPFVKLKPSFYDAEDPNIMYLCRSQEGPFIEIIGAPRPILPLESAAFANEKREFARAARNFMADVREDLCSVQAMLLLFESLHRKFPMEFANSGLDTGLLEMLTYLVQWEALFWDPFLSLTYIDWRSGGLYSSAASTNGGSLMNEFWNLKWTSTVASFGGSDRFGNSEQSDLFVGEHAEDKYTVGKFLISSLTTKVTFPRLLHWIRHCWNPLSLEEAKQLAYLVRNHCLPFLDPAATFDLARLGGAVMQKLREEIAAVIVYIFSIEADCAVAFLMAFPLVKSACSSVVHCAVAATQAPSGKCHGKQTSVFHSQKLPPMPWQSHFTQFVLEEICWAAATIAQSAAQFDAILTAGNLCQILWTELLGQHLLTLFSMDSAALPQSVPYSIAVVAFPTSKIRGSDEQMPSSVKLFLQRAFDGRVPSVFQDDFNWMYTLTVPQV